MNQTDNQLRIAKISKVVNSKLDEASISNIAAYLNSADSPTDLATLCSSLAATMASFSGINEKLTTTNAINNILTTCQIISLSEEEGNTPFYHEDYTHSFYRCDTTGGTPHLLYTTTNDLSSFTAAGNICANWALGLDLYGSYTNDCTNAVMLGNYALQYCLAGMDHPNV